MIFLAEGVDPSTLERLGVAGIVAVFLLAGLVWAVRQWQAERARNEALTERLLSLAERTLPTLDRAERALDRMERQ